MSEIYKVINKNGEEVGTVYDDLSVFIPSVSNFDFKNIEELLIKLEDMELHLNDMEGDLYNLNIHNNWIENIKKFGMGCAYK